MFRDGVFILNFPYIRLLFFSRALRCQPTQLGSSSHSRQRRWRGKMKNPIKGGEKSWFGMLFISTNLTFWLSLEERLWLWAKNKSWNLRVTTKEKTSYWNFIPASTFKRRATQIQTKCFFVFLYINMMLIPPSQPSIAIISTLTCFHIYIKATSMIRKKHLS